MIGRLLEIMGLRERAGSDRSGRTMSLSASMRHEQIWRMFAGYDTAKSDGENAAHWSSADGMAAWSANSPEVRETLRNRARYEVANHSLVAGMMRTLATHTVGRGPKLIMDTGSRGLDRQIQAAWAGWSRNVGLAEKLRLMRRVKCVDGEAFGLMFSNPALDGVQLDLRLIEADQVATPDLPVNDPLRIDGVRFDAAGNPRVYDVLRHHPGDDRSLGNPLDYDEVPAANMLHYAHTTRPGEVRGVSELTPALALGAILRRYVLATLLNAENAARIAGTIESESPEVTAAVEALESIQLEASAFMVMPDGWKAKAFKSEQPVTGFREFRREIANEFGRCIDMPLNIVLANSQDYNFASGKLDHGVYYESIRVEREDQIEGRILDPLFRTWLREAALVPGLIDGELRFEEIKHYWRWPALPVGDEEKQAKTAAILRRERLLTLERYYGERGEDWEEELEQHAVEDKAIDRLGLAPIDRTDQGAKPRVDVPTGVGADGGGGDDA